MQNAEYTPKALVYQLQDNKVYNHVIRQRVSMSNRLKELGKDSSLDISEVLDEVIRFYISK
jgi:hypothetical protein